MTDNMWQMYLERQYKEIDMAEVGLEGHWVKVIPPSCLTPSQEAAFLKRLKEASEQSASIEQFTPVMKTAVKAWSFTDFEGNPLPVPAEADTWKEVIPLSVLLHIVQKFNQLAEEMIPKENVSKS